MCCGSRRELDSRLFKSCRVSGFPLDTVHRSPPYGHLRVDDARFQPYCEVFKFMLARRLRVWQIAKGHGR